MHDDRERKVVHPRTGLVPWSRAAFTVLQETAARYGATITSAELAEEVQRRTGLYTQVGARSWVGQILRPLILHCHKEGLPALTALVVHAKDGLVGDGYIDVLEVTGQSPIGDPQARELHAAAARLECYRRYCDSVPADAVPTLAAPSRAVRTSQTPRSAGSGASRTSGSAGEKAAAAGVVRASGARPGRAVAPAKPAQVAHAAQRVCTRCFLEMPTTGVCPNCD